MLINVVSELETAVSLSVTLQDQGMSQGASDQAEWEAMALNSVTAIGMDCAKFAPTMLAFVKQFGGGIKKKWKLVVDNNQGTNASVPEDKFSHKECHCCGLQFPEKCYTPLTCEDCWHAHCDDCLMDGEDFPCRKCIGLPCPDRSGPRPEPDDGGEQELPEGQ